VVSFFLVLLAALAPVSAVQINSTTFESTELQALLNTLSQQASISQVELDDVRSICLADTKASAILLHACNDYQAYIVAAACAGIPGDNQLGDSLIAQGLRRNDLKTSLACLLAPDKAKLRYLPELASLSLDSNKDLALRAVAVSRLLKHGASSAWPVAKSIFLTGTKADRPTPWNDWERTGRYELPKRILKLQIEEWLGRTHFKQESNFTIAFEPNAAWNVQLKQLEQLENILLPKLAAKSNQFDYQHSSRKEITDFQIKIAGLIKAGDKLSLRCVALLMPLSKSTLTAALAKPDPVLQSAARRSLELIPR